MKKQFTNDDDARDVSIIITDRLIECGYIKSCIDTDNSTEFDIQDIIQEEISKVLVQLTGKEL